MNIRVIAIAVLLMGAGLTLGGIFEDAPSVAFVEPASACEHPQKGCGSCWLDPGDLERGILPHIECHN